MCVGITREALSVLCCRQQYVLAAPLVKSQLLQSLLVLVFAVLPSPVNPLPVPLMVWTMWPERLFQLSIPANLVGELVHFCTACGCDVCTGAWAECVSVIPTSALVHQMEVETAV